MTSNTSNLGASSPLPEGGKSLRIPLKRTAAPPLKSNVRRLMQIIGPSLSAKAECEAVLRSLPLWFGIEESLLEYVKESERLPTFAVSEAGRIVGFLSLMQHFPTAWEIHCVAVHAQSRNQGYGKALLAHAERWLVGKGTSLLQVKTMAATSASASYAQTREFYSHLGFLPLEVFPHLWSPSNPCLQLVKYLSEDA